MKDPLSMVTQPHGFWKQTLVLFYLDLFIWLLECPKIWWLIFPRAEDPRDQSGSYNVPVTGILAWDYTELNVLVSAGLYSSHKHILVCILLSSLCLCRRIRAWSLLVHHFASSASSITTPYFLCKYLLNPIEFTWQSIPYTYLKRAI